MDSGDSKELGPLGAESLQEGPHQAPQGTGTLGVLEGQFEQRL